MNHTTIRLAIIIIAATLMISGTIFYPMVRKQQAYSATSATHQVKSEEEAAVRSSLQQRGQQHMDQENLCLRTSDCNNSNVGEQTLGNDNSITGFADQSNNVQAVVTPTPTVTPTPVVTPTPTPTPTPTLTPCDPNTEDFLTVNKVPELGALEEQQEVTAPPGSLCPTGEDEPSNLEETSGDTS